VEKKTANKKYRKYDGVFKAEVLKMTKIRSVAEVARSMGIGENLLYKWPSEYSTR